MASTHPLTYYFLELLKKKGINIKHVDAIELTDEELIFSEKGAKHIIQITRPTAPQSMPDIEIKGTRKRTYKRKLKPFEDLSDHL